MTHSNFPWHLVTTMVIFVSIQFKKESQWSGYCQHNITAVKMSCWNWIKSFVWDFACVGGGEATCKVLRRGRHQKLSKTLQTPKRHSSFLIAILVSTRLIKTIVIWSSFHSSRKLCLAIFHFKYSIFMLSSFWTCLLCEEQLFKFTQLCKLWDISDMSSLFFI